MRISGWIVLALALGLGGSPALGKELPLPAETEIPGDYVTLLCPDLAAGRDVLDNYLVPGELFVDTTTFQRGVEANGCGHRQDRVGPIKIEAVLDRRNVQPGQTYIVYRGTMADGASVIGVLHEAGHNAHPRNVLEQFLAVNTQSGVIAVGEGEHGAYSCPTPNGAVAVVDAAAASTDPLQQLAALRTGLAEHGCVAAVGEFRVTAWHNDVYIEGEYTADQGWTALSAVDQNGGTIGLLYDASAFR